MWTREDKYDKLDAKGIEVMRRDNCKSWLRKGHITKFFFSFPSPSDDFRLLQADWFVI